MPSERIQFLVETLLNDATESVNSGEWPVVEEKARAVLAIAPQHADALALLQMAQAKVNPEMSSSREEPSAEMPADPPPPPTSTYQCIDSGRLARWLGRSRGVLALSFDDTNLIIGRNFGNERIALLAIGSVRPGHPLFWGSIRIDRVEGQGLEIFGLPRRHVMPFASALSEAVASARLAQALLTVRHLSHDIDQLSRAADELLSEIRFVSAGRGRLWTLEAAPIVEELQAVWPDGDGEVVEAELLAAQALVRTYDRFDMARCKQNSGFVCREVGSPFFDTLDQPPTLEQRVATVTAEDNVLVVAGAGTGKTRTITTKIAYAVGQQKLPQSRVLAIAFTRTAAREMDERLAAMGLDGVTVSTLHALGNRIIAEAEERKLSLSGLAEDPLKLHSELQRFLEDLLADPQYASTFLSFGTELFFPCRLWPEFTSEGKYYEWARDQNLRSMSGDLVKSYEELRIANFLYVRGINFEYESPYEKETATRKYSQYRPDFYLPAYEVYIEHFGLDAQGQPPPLYSEADQVQYLKGVEYKRGIHEENLTKLVQTFSYQFSDDSIFDTLERELKCFDVEFEPLSPDVLLDLLNELGLTYSFTEKVATVLGLFKSSRMSTAELERRASASEEPKRATAFVALLIPLYEKYQLALRESGTLDYHDMIIDATEHLNQARVRTRWQLVIVDEFQDITGGQAEFIKALVGQDDLSELFCVGDDWQSIYRFAGGDVSLMRDFADRFGVTEQLPLTETFRFNDQIADVSQGFILKNPDQIPKHLTTRTTATDKRVQLLWNSSSDQAVASALNWIAAYARSARRSVLILGRYNFSKPPTLASAARLHRNLTVRYSTVHSAKGSEEDFVVILDLNNSRTGFPSQKDDDPLMHLVLPEPGTFPYAEERRVFYVALTRAQQAVLLVADPYAPSEFVTELLDSDAVGVADGAPAQISPCPACTAGRLRVVRPPDGTPFHSCTNYPQCPYTEPFGPSNTERVCPRCERGHLIERNGRNGPFFGCSGYTHFKPPCRYTE